MSKTYDQVIQELDAKIPRDCISSREGGGRSKLSYLEGHYVIDRLNKVLGIGNWAYRATATVVHTDTVNNSVHYTAQVHLVVELPGGIKTEFVDYGYGDGSDKFKIGKAHELAVKEAVTDGIKRCAKNLGMSMGLALYDKTQENVEEAAAPEKATAQAAKPEPKRDVTQYVPDKKAAATGAREVVNKGIHALNNVLLAKAGPTGSPERAAKLAELREMMKSKYGVEKSTDLTDDQAKELLETLKGLANA